MLGSLGVVFVFELPLVCGGRAILAISVQSLALNDSTAASKVADFLYTSLRRTVNLNTTL